MPTMNEVFTNALLADASYVANLAAAATPGALTQALSERMTPTLAASISKNFSVVTQIESGLSSFDSVVWRANNSDGTPNPSGKLYVSMRGTQQFTDFLVDADLSVTGNARAQVTDMINWWLRISTPVGQQAKQISAQGSLYVAATSVMGEGVVSAADLASGIEVNGHSLGGYLATAFTRLFGSQAQVQHTSTFNSAGFAPGSEAVFTELQNLIGPSYGLGRYPSTSEQSNYFASNGLNFTTNSFYFGQQGQRVDLFNELDVTQLGNHYMYKLTDALALGGALSKLDTTLTGDKLNLLLAAGSNNTAASIEGVLDGLRRAFQGGNVTPTQVGDVSDSAASRAAYHSAPAGLQNSATFSSLAGKLFIKTTSAGDLRAAARNNFGAIVALQDLSAIVISGINPAAEAVLTSVWQSTRAADYTAWTIDKSMSTPSTFTDSWITDRTTLLTAVTARNSKDGDGLAYSNAFPTDRAYDLHWIDASGTEKMLIAENTARQGGVLIPVPIQRFAFGGDAADALTGSDINLLGDHLYGGAGNDTLNGMSGNDYLEGNIGDDILIGGTGADTLLGGAGTDTYQFTATFGNDTILDSDGAGLITVDGTQITGGKKIADNLWQSDDKQLHYILRGNGDLVITKATGTDSITIKSWQNQPGNKLGIILNDAPVPVDAPSATLVFNGDQRAKIIGGETQLTVTAGQATHGSYAWGETSWTTDGTLTVGVIETNYADVIYATAAGSSGAVMRGYGGNDALSGSIGRDDIFGDAGDDLIGGGAGSDNIRGGDGNDTILSATTLAAAQRNKPGDQYTLPAGSTARTSGPTWATYLNGDGDVFIGGGGPITHDSAGDIVDAGAGDDIVLTGKGADRILAGEGKDLVWGGEGNDILKVVAALAGYVERPVLPACPR